MIKRYPKPEGAPAYRRVLWDFSRGLWRCDPTVGMRSRYLGEYSNPNIAARAFAKYVSEFVAAGGVTHPSDTKNVDVRRIPLPTPLNPHTPEAWGLIQPLSPLDCRLFNELAPEASRPAPPPTYTEEDLAPPHIHTDAEWFERLNSYKKQELGATPTPPTPPTQRPSSRRPNAEEFRKFMSRKQEEWELSKALASKEQELREPPTTPTNVEKGEIPPLTPEALFWLEVGIRLGEASRA
jgi:hypothetical protein